jgi:hypothetical protein
METLTFEVVGFHGAYHTILGRSCYTKFMAVPNYTYLNLKMLGPNGIITVGTSVQCAYECDVECCELASVIIASEELPAVHQVVNKEAPNAKRSFGSFKPVEDTEEVLIDPGGSDGKMVHVNTALPPNRNA